ncbi:hypothetical protein RIF29_06956 [Crotalaria pallida]|uniref:RNA-directed RNA polymerase n=1 Tax=Crotalaria pallida TaxID=3830 RepID=A0AAN9J4U3_CROPI
MGRNLQLEAPQKHDTGNLKYSSPQPLFSPFKTPYEYDDGNVTNEKEATPSSSLSSSLSRISPLILLVIIVLAVIFFIYGLIHLVLWFYMKRPSPSSLFNSNNRFQESNRSRSLQRQLQQLFRLHDSGLDQALIDSLPVFYYQDLLGLKNNEPFDCAVCLCEFSDQDKLRLVPMCSHAFHMNCLDTWLLSNSTCPLCRATLSNSSCCYSLENPMWNMLRVTNEEYNECSHSQREVAAEEQINGKRVFSVRLGSFRSSNGLGVESSSSCSLDVKRCYSMGSYQYVVPDSNLQVVLSQSYYDSGRVSEGNEDVDGKRISNRIKGESFSVSKIWLWSKKSKYHHHSSSNDILLLLQRLSLSLSHSDSVHSLNPSHRAMETRLNDDDNGTPKPNPSATVRISNLPQSSTADDLLRFLHSIFGPSSVFALEIWSHNNNWNSRGISRVQFETLPSKSKALSLSLQNDLVFMSHFLQVTDSFSDIIPRPLLPRNRVENTSLYAGFMKSDGCMSVLESWDGVVKGWVMPERNRLEFFVPHAAECYKLEIMFEDIVETIGYCLEGGDNKLNAIVFKLKYGPKIYQKKAGPNMATKFKADRYHFCKEDFEFLWVRTTDFSPIKSIGHSTSFCWELEEEPFASDIFQSFPRYKSLKDLKLEDGEEFGSSNEIVPLVKCASSSKLPYESLFQLNSLVHTQKISLASVDDDLIDLLGSLDEETKSVIFQKLHKLESTCYEPLKFVRTQLHVLSSRDRRLLPSSQKRLRDNNIMSCHRALITPSKIYCLGPELETSNHVVKHFASYASDFMRVTFVEEDWTKLQPNAVSCRAQKGTSVSSRVQKVISASSCVQRGIFPKPFRTEIYKRILTILRDGIVIGSKKFEFLAFSASQLRSSSVWLFASNDNVKAADIREWMGSFNNIRSVSKCAARMGQLFSSSMQTLEVPAQDVEIIPDVEVTTDCINYCFSDGIGKISQSFARQIAQKLKLDSSRIPSAFQIRYGGYKGVIAVDRHSYRKLSLRSSMLKFESKNRMLCVTKWSESMPCFLNREIISLLSTLGINDEVFLALQQEQLNLLARMLTDSKAALDVLESLSGADSKSILVKMLHGYYEPNSEPYLSMMLKAHYAYQLSDLKSKCRIFVPKGRILVGCLDETGLLNYGQVFVRITVKKTKQQFEDDSLRKVDGGDSTRIIVGKVVVTKNPCLHPGDIRVLDAIYSEELEEKGLRDCLVFPQKGHRPHPNECSGGDLDGDLFFISWDKELIPSETEAPMDYTGRRPRFTDHKVTLEEIHHFFVDYMINDTLGAISTAHLVHCDREPDKAKSRKCRELADLHSMAVDFAKTGAPAEMPRVLKPKEFPDFMDRVEKPMYISNGALGKLYRAINASNMQASSNSVWSEKLAEEAYDQDLEVRGFEVFIETALSHKEMYAQKMSSLMNFYCAKTEDEMLTGNLQNKASYLQRDNRRYGDMKDRILIAVKNLQHEAKEWFETSCQQHEYEHLASAWYNVTYHPTYFQEGSTFLSFPWIVGDILLQIKSAKC